MKIFVADDIRAIDARTIEREGVSSLTLIERVAEGAATEIAARWRPTRQVTIFAGSGNNGADALATARRLMDLGFRPSIYLFNIGSNRLSADCRRCRDELMAAYPDADMTEITTKFSTPELTPHTLVVDGLFGTGLNEPLSGGFMALVRYINESRATVVSLDMPSGMFADWNQQTNNRDIVHATLTLCVQFPRISFFFPENAELVGEWKVLDIGLSSEAIQQTPTNFHYVEEAEVRRLLRKRPQFSSKADYGTACIVAGSYGMIGAAVLACRGAIRSGVGRLTLHSPQCGYEIVQSSCPEATFDPDSNKLVNAEIELKHEFSAIGIGPGMGTRDITVNAVESFLKRQAHPIVIDADALNCIAIRPTMIKHIPALSVLTPHAGEFDRLFGIQQSSEQRLLKAIEVAREHGLLILLKGRYTALVRPDGKVYFNSSGTPAMATPGSGDVLTGIITSLMAQGYKPEVSALIGAYIHGVAGEMAAAEHGDYGVAASDIAACTGRAIKRIMNL